MENIIIYHLIFMLKEKNIFNNIFQSYENYVFK